MAKKQRAYRRKQVRPVKTAKAEVARRRHEEWARWKGRRLEGDA